MMVLKKAAIFFVLIAATLLFTACPSQTNIRKINANPDRYRGKEVGIAGRVTDSYGALGVGARPVVQDPTFGVRLLNLPSRIQTVSLTMTTTAPWTAPW